MSRDGFRPRRMERTFAASPREGDDRMDHGAQIQKERTISGRAFASAWRYPLVGVFLALLIASCDDSVGGGGGSDVPNDLNGRVVLASGDPAAEVRVVLRRIPVRPDEVVEEHSVWTDSDGRYRLEGHAGGAGWSLEWRDSLRGQGAYRLLGDRDAELGTLREVRLERLGSLAGTCVSDNREVIATDRLWIPELARLVTPDSTGSWAFRTLPPGVHTARLLTQAKADPFLFPTSRVPAGERLLLEPILLMDSALGAWRGVFQDSAGARLPGVRVTWSVLGESTQRTVLARSDDSGRIILPNPSTGSWTYTFARPSGTSRTLEVRVPDTTSNRRWSLPRVVVLD
jgi:hypothetical protein